MAALCDSCSQDVVKYRCPRCDWKSCSLACVQKHKVERECSGIRSKTSYISLRSFSDQHLLSDYYFLEEVGRIADSSQRKRTCFREYSDQRKKFNWLRFHAEKRGIKLHLLPVGMLRHTINTSKSLRDQSRRKEWVIHWRVHLHFPECNISYEEESISEDKTLCELLDNYLHPVKSEPVARHQLHGHVKNGGVDGVEVWLEGGRGVPPHLMTLNSTLKENLNNRTVIEFPEFHVVSKSAGPPTAALSSAVLTSSSSSPPSKRVCSVSGQCQGVDTNDGGDDGPPPKEVCSVSSQCQGMDTNDGGDEKVEGSSSASASLKLIASMYSDSEDSTDSE